MAGPLCFDFFFGGALDIPLPFKVSKHFGDGGWWVDAHILPPPLPYNSRTFGDRLYIWNPQKMAGYTIEGRKEMFYLTTHSTHFIYGYMASDIWLRTIMIVRKETRCRHIGYSFRLAARVLLYAPSHRQDSTHPCLCYTSRGALAGTRNSSKGPPHEGSIRRPTAPWANALPLSYVPLPGTPLTPMLKIYISLNI